MLRGVPFIYHYRGSRQDQPMNSIYFTPFSLRMSALQAFFEIPFSGHDVYHSLEVQKWRVHEGSAVLVLMTRASGEVDVFSSMSQSLSADWFFGEAATALHEFGSVQSTAFAKLEFSISEEGLFADIDFRDGENRSIQLKAVEPHQEDSEVFSVFAPAPFRVSPTLIRFLSMRRLALCKRAAAQFSLRIDCALMQPVTLPSSPLVRVPLGGRLRYSARYCADLLLASLNAVVIDHCGCIGSETDLRQQLASSTEPVWVSGEQFETLIDEGKKGELLICAHRVRNKCTSLVLSFDPPFIAMKKDCQIEGSGYGGVFSLESGGEQVCSGEYQFTKGGEMVSLRLVNVKQEWKPSVQTFSIRVMLWLRRIRRRGENYRLDAEIYSDGGSIPRIVSRWTGLKG